jgi:predicted ATPase/DNA-binding CsgD family transcriptional regulator
MTDSEDDRIGASAPLLQVLAALVPGITRPPQPLTSFVDREIESARIASLLGQDGVRLVTLTGAGGVGKTRLALCVADEVASAFPDGVSYVPLGAVTDPDQVLPAISRSIGIPVEDPAEAVERLVRALRSRRLLLVLDNVEQVRLGAPALAYLLITCPDVRMLTTSRTRLRVSGEHVVAVPPLELPDTGRSATPEQLSNVAAVRLFVERARAVDPSFALTAENVVAVAEICRRLDGLPLAIELAAARVATLPPRALLARLEQRLPMLKGGPHDAPARHRTLQDTIGWSYALLDADERRLFTRLSVFVGDFSLEAVEAVLSLPFPASSPGEAPVPESVPSVLDLIFSLVEHSLLEANREHDAVGDPRFVLMETIREYALTRLGQSGEEAECRWRHAEYFRELVDFAELELTGPKQRVWLDRLELDAANLRAAMSWAISAGDADLSLDLAGGLFLFWLKRGRVAEGQAWLERALAMPEGGPSPARVRALVASLGLAGPTADIELTHEGLTLARQIGDMSGVAKALHHIGAATLAKRPADAMKLFEQALDHYDDDRDHAWRAMTLTLLGLAAHRVGDTARAEATLEEAITLSAQHGGEWEQALALNGLASVVRSRGESAQAAGLYAESLHVAEKLGDAAIATEALMGFAGVLADSNRADEAARLFGAAEALNEAMGFSGERLATPHQYHRDVSGVRERLGDEAFATTWAQGRAMPAHELLRAARAAVERSAGPRTRTRGAAIDRGPVLTPRERDVLRLLADRLSDREIGSHLFIGTRTAEFHVANIIGKLGVADRREAAATAAQLGLV